MRRVIWTDKNGYKHVSLIRDDDPDSMAPRGIPQDPPFLGDILEDAKRELHNELVSRGLLTYKDVERSQNGVTTSILGVLRHKIIQAYRSKEKE